MAKEQQKNEVFKVKKLSTNTLNIKLESTSESNVCLKDFSGQNIVLYFYPKDLTPGCTNEGTDFTQLYPQFKRQNAVILGVSRDNIKLHYKFKEKYGFKFDLLSDVDENLCKAFDVMKLKKLYGREYIGVDRSTFLINKEGQLVYEWRNVKVKGHAEEVLNKLKAT